MCCQIVPSSISFILDSCREMSSTEGGPRLKGKSDTLTQFSMSLKKNKVLVDNRDFQRVQEAISFGV